MVRSAAGAGGVGKGGRLPNAPTYAGERQYRNIDLQNDVDWYSQSLSHQTN